MKSGVKKCLLVMIAAGLLAALIPANAFAATKAITSISIRVGMNVEAGDYLSDDPEIFNDDSGTHSDSTYVGANNEKYVIGDAEWVSLANKTLTVGDKPRMRVYIRSTGYTSGDSEYVFRGSYSSSNVHVSGGTFVSVPLRPAPNGEIQVMEKRYGIRIITAMMITQALYFPGTTMFICTAAAPLLRNWKITMEPAMISILI